MQCIGWKTVASLTKNNCEITGMAVKFLQQRQARFCQNLPYIYPQRKKVRKKIFEKKARKQISCLRAKKDFRRDFMQRSTA